MEILQDLFLSEEGLGNVTYYHFTFHFMYFGFSSLLKIRESKGDMHGIKGCRETHSLSHLLFYLLMIIFYFVGLMRKNLISSKMFWTLMGKSRTNTTQSHKQRISSFLGVTNQISKGKYLGLPSIIGRSNKSVFGILKDRLWKHINHWFTKHPSKADKETLIKSCVQVIPSYCMSVFLLPTSLQD